MPTLSIIVPIYNVEKFLPECIESVINQPFENEDEFELMLVHDGSPDNCLSICREYEKRHKNVCVIDQPNAGVAAARNAGLEHASGKYVCFLDGDDCLLPGVLPSLVRSAESNDVDMLSFSACTGTNFAEKCIGQENGGGEVEILVGRDYKRKYWAHSVVWGKLFKRDFFIRNRIRFNPNLTVFEDWFFWIEAIPRLGKTAVVKTRGYFYRINYSGFTKNNSSAVLLLGWRLWRDKVFFRINSQMLEYQKEGDSALAAAYEKWRRGVILPMFWRALKGGLPVAEMENDIRMFKNCGCYPIKSPSHSSVVSIIAARIFSMPFLLLTVLRVRNFFK